MRVHKRGVKALTAVAAMALGVSGLAACGGGSSSDDKTVEIWMSVDQPVFDGLKKSMTAKAKDAGITLKMAKVTDINSLIMTKIQANAYVTAYSTLEDDVFIAPGVITTNDNYMGRTEKRHELRRGPTIRRGARVGGGAVLCPGVEIGEEAFVGAGAVVLENVPPRAVMVGNPARKIRDVPDEELLS